MGRDRSLDEFFDGESDGSAASDDDPDADASTDPEDPDSGAETGPEPTPDEDGNDDSDAADGDTATAPDDVEPAAVTYRWTPDGVRCADCGATVEQLWSGESGQVCAECKEW